METKWQLHCMNSFIDGVIINDFENDTEAAQYAANYEARCPPCVTSGSPATWRLTLTGSSWGKCSGSSV